MLRPDHRSAQPVQSGGRLSASDRAHHLATVTHEGRFWDVYVEVMPQASPRDPLRARLAFSAADNADERFHTAAIFVEASLEEILERARELGEHRTIALLRSCLP